MIWRLLVFLGLVLVAVFFSRLRSTPGRIAGAVFVLFVAGALGLAAGSHVTDEFRARKAPVEITP